MKFQGEVGGIVNQQGNLINIIEGGMYRVVFPQEMLHQLHKASPGCVYLLAHTHPNGMTELSGEDKSTLKAQALAMYPFPARMSTITVVKEYLTGIDPKTNEQLTADNLYETVYLGFWEDKEKWKKRNEGSDVLLSRIYTLVKESVRTVPISGTYSSILANISYGEEEEDVCLT